MLGLGFGFTSPAVLGGGGGAFTPAAAGDLSLHLSALDSARFQNSNGTTAAVANNDPVGYWGDISGGRHVIQATAANRPFLQTALPSLLFDGTNDHLAWAGGLTDTEGSAVILFKTGATDFGTRGLQALVSSADAGAASEWFEIGITAQARIYVERNAGGTKHTIIGSSFLENSTVYTLVVAFNNVDYYAQVGAVEQNPLRIESVGTFSWFGDVVGADNVVVGGAVTSAGLVRPFQGEILELMLYGEAIT